MEGQPTTEPTGRLLDLWPRLLAKFVDLGVVAVFEVLLMALLVAGHAFGGPFTPARQAGSLLLVLLAGAPYFAHFGAGGRQTLGYRLAGIRAVTLAGEPVGWARSAVRTLPNYLLLALSWPLAVLLNFLVVALSRSRETAHDRIARTKVVRVAPVRRFALGAGALCGIASPFVIVFGFARPFLLQAFYIPSGAMTPTLAVNDKILVNKLYYRLRRPQRGDVVVFKAPPAADPDEKDFIKRVVGLPGDTVEVRGGKVHISGRALKQEPASDKGGSPVLEHTTPEGAGTGDVSYRIAEPPDYQMPPVKVKPGHVFVLGDNRNNSKDSHYWGPLDVRRIRGKAMCIYWPRGHACALP